MKLAYMAHWDASRESGVLKKIAQQMRAWLQAGHSARLFLLSEGEALWSGLEGLDVTLLPRGTRLQRFPRAARLAAQVRAWGPDLIYLRQDTYLPAFEGLARQIPTVVEVNTRVLQERRLLSSKAAYLYHRLTALRISRAACGLVCVTREIAADYAPMGKPVLVSANGIPLAAFPELPAPSSPFPRVVFIGSPGPLIHWQGVDKILWLAHELPGWQFDLIGVSRGLTGPQSPPNLRMHGWLTQAEYFNLLSAADIALGTLSLYRKALNEASPLKVREYLACGIPTVIGYADTDFPEPVPFLLQLPNTPDNVSANLEKITCFMEKWRGQRVPRAAVAHLDLAGKEKIKLEFFASLLKGAP